MNTTLHTHGELLPALHGAEVVYDLGTAEHSMRVGNLCGLIAGAIGLESTEVEAMRWVGLLHDLGKLAVPREVLHRAGPLNDREWDEVRQHPIVGADLVLAISSKLAPIAGAIRAHHERWNGSGYPDGRDTLEIPLMGRIVAISDVFDALTHRRPYRPGTFTHRQAVEFIVERANEHFDPELVRVFVDLDERGLIVPAPGPPGRRRPPQAVVRSLSSAGEATRPATRPRP